MNKQEKCPGCGVETDVHESAHNHYRSMEAELAAEKEKRENAECAVKAFCEEIYKYGPHQPIIDTDLIYMAHKIEAEGITHDDARD